MFVLFYLYDQFRQQISSLFSWSLGLEWNDHTPTARHNGRDSVSNHQPQHCLLDRLFRRRSKKTSKLRVTGVCVGNSPGTGEFPAQMASNAEMFPFDDVVMFPDDRHPWQRHDMETLSRYWSWNPLVNSPHKKEVMLSCDLFIFVVSLISMIDRYRTAKHMKNTPRAQCQHKS